MAENKQGMSRRNFLKNSGLVAGGLVGGSLFGGLVTSQFSKGKDDSSKKNDGSPVVNAEVYQARTFFNRTEDFVVLEAAVERIFPENDNGAGAIALGVPFFIDKQCTGEWGMNTNDYMQGPFPQINVTETYEEGKGDGKATPSTVVNVAGTSPRYQTKMTRSVLLLEGIREIEAQSQKKFGERFVKIEAAQQDELLTMFANGDFNISGVKSDFFFSLLRQTTLEGVYADPVYGGNRNMEAWKMKQYPGPRMSWMNEVDAEEFLVIEPEGLREYQGH